MQAQPPQQTLFVGVPSPRWAGSTIGLILNVVIFRVELQTEFRRNFMTHTRTHQQTHTHTHTHTHTRTGSFSAKALAKYSYIGQQADELKFAAGDVVTITGVSKIVF
jgi:hypothetical protein